jgi:hypothetical protein
MAGDDVLEIQIISNNSDASTIQQNTNGTVKVDNLKDYKASYNENSEYNKLFNLIGSDQTTFNEAFKNSVSKDQGNNWKLFEYKSKEMRGSIMGTAVINGNTAATSRQRRAALNEILNKFVFKCTTCIDY